MKKHYDKFYEIRSSEWRKIGALDKANNILRLCAGHKPIKVLEIGAGDGSILERLSDLGFAKELYGLEISSSGLEAIKEKNIKGLVDCSLFDGYTVKYENAEFDLVILSHVVEHVEFPRKLIYEAARVSKLLFVEVPLEDTVRLPGNYVASDLGHINFYSPVTMRQLLQTCSLGVIDEIITNRSRASHTYLDGQRGLISYLVKEALLKISPKLAVRLFTYHGSFLCKNIKSD